MAACGKKDEASAVADEVVADDTAVAQTDIDGLKAFIEESKAPFVEFSAVVAPESYAKAHEKLVSGCNGMVEYLDLCVKVADGDADAATKLVDVLTKVQTDFTEGSTLIAQ